MIEDPSPESWPVAASTELLSNWLITVRSDKVQMPDGSHADRTVVTHIGAVGVVALDDDDRVLMIRQYRHPAGRQLWEIPAGLRDVSGEALVDTARRELEEETGYAAARWDALVDSYASPGITSERIRLFLARDLTPVISDYQREAEEKFLRQDRMPLDEAVQAALAGKLHNGATIQGVLAAYIARSVGFSTLRPADAPEA
jgi:8-oxo-dGTP pyrophosphatase MutT (NUDIX family)